MYVMCTYIHTYAPGISDCNCRSPVPHLLSWVCIGMRPCPKALFARRRYASQVRQKCTPVRVRVRACERVCVCVFSMHMDVHAYTYIYVYTHTLYAFIYIYVYVCIHTYILIVPRIYMYIHTYIHTYNTYTYTYMHICIYTYTYCEFLTSRPTHEKSPTQHADAAPESSCFFASHCACFWRAQASAIACSLFAFSSSCCFCSR